VLREEAREKEKERRKEQQGERNLSPQSEKCNSDNCCSKIK
jgi:hypothetical protein